MDCLYDPISPVNIINRASAHFCPAGKFPETDAEVEDVIAAAAETPGAPGPGDVVKMVLRKLGYLLLEDGQLQCPGGVQVADCGCDGMRVQMNAWGYAGCLMRLGEIKQWFMAKAAACGLVSDDATIGELLAAALDEWMSRPVSPE